MNIATKERISSVDFLKGIALILITFGNVRYFFHSSAFYFSPTNIDVTSVSIFLARFIPNFAAPIFCFLAGVSIFFISKNKTKPELAHFLWKRGLWLVFMDFTVVTFALYFDIHFSVISFSTFSAFGVSMVFLAGLIFLPRIWLTILSVLIIFGHNLLDTFAVKNSIWWSLMHQPSSFTFFERFTLVIDYPFLPWLGVMSLGYCFGVLYSKGFEQSQRRFILNVVGVWSIAIFLILRTINTYGDQYQWLAYDNVSQTLMSFLKLTKYPPSLLYLLLTLGVMFIILANSESLKGKILDYISFFGRLPFFYYIVHTYIVHYLALVYAQMTGFGWQSMILQEWVNSSSTLRGYGVGLMGVSLVSGVVILIMYALCKKFLFYKEHHKQVWWIKYL